MDEPDLSDLQISGEFEIDYMISKMADHDLQKKEYLLQVSIYEIFKSACFIKYANYCDKIRAKRKKAMNIIDDELN